MGRLSTIAQHTVREAVRTRVVVAFGGLVVAMVALLPLAVYREGGQAFALVQTFLSWSLMPLGVILSFLAVFLGAMSISGEMANHQVFMLFSKPIQRWKYILGKWLGVMVVMTFLLALAGLLIYGMTYCLAGEPGSTTSIAWVLVHGGIGLQLAVVLILASRRVGFWRSAAALLTAQCVLVAVTVALAVTLIARPEWASAVLWGWFYGVCGAYLLLSIAVLVRGDFGAWTAGLTVLALALIVVGVYLVAMTRYFAARQAVSTYDRLVLANEVMTARARTLMQTPDYSAQVEVWFQRLQEEGLYREDSATSIAEVKSGLYKTLVGQYHRVPTGGYQTFQFRGINTAALTDGSYLHLRYKARGEGYAPDEALISYWYFGPTPQLATQRRPIPRKDVMDRYQSVPFPADAVAPDGTVYAVVRNMEILREEHQGAGFKFEQGSLQVLYTIGTFGGNLTRTLFLVWCRISVLTAVGVFGATMLSYPVACLVCFVFYVMSVVSGFVMKALEFGIPGEGALGKAQFVIEPVLNLLFAIMPNFAQFDGVPDFVDGRNVSLMWDLIAFGKLVVMLTVPILIVACIIFRRRQVAELSI